MTANRPRLARKLWAANIAAIAADLRDQGVAADVAWARAAEMCRDPDAALVEEPVPAPVPREHWDRQPRDGSCQSLILEYLEGAPPSDRREIAAAIGMPIPTVSRQLRRMAERGRIVARGERASSGTRPARLWCLP